VSAGGWSGGVANREWNRAAGQGYFGRLARDAEHRLYLAVADECFYCEACGACHPLREHRICRAS
jgi:hypothetical protein